MQTYQEKLLQCVPASLRARSGNADQEELGRKNAPVAVMFVDIEGQREKYHEHRNQDRVTDQEPEADCREN